VTAPAKLLWLACSVVAAAILVAAMGLYGCASVSPVYSAAAVNIAHCTSLIDQARSEAGQDCQAYAAGLASIREMHAECQPMLDGKRFQCPGGSK
jgi:hypothetical protein